MGLCVCVRFSCFLFEHTCDARRAVFMLCTWVQSLGLTDLSQVLANPPPGIDELVALSRVLKLARSEE